jgi:uncharacterized membrane protein YbhN (UPF0104 family)
MPVIRSTPPVSTSADQTSGTPDHSDSAAAGRSGIRITAVLGSLGSIACFLWAVRDLSWTTFREQLAETDWRWIAIALILEISTYVVQGARWRVLLGSGTLRQMTQTIYAGLFVSEILPLRPGDTLRTWLMVRYTNRRTSDVITSVVWERWIDGLVLLASMWASSFIVPLPTWIGSALRVLLLAVIGVAAALIVVQRRHPRSRGDNKRIVPTSPCVWGYSVLLIGVQTLAFWTTLYAAGAHISAGAAVVVFLIVRLGTLIPSAPGNLGTHQAACITGLKLFGITGPIASSLSMLAFLVSTAPPYLLGWLAMTSSGFTLSSFVRANSRRSGLST